jgi:hypothetical protein
MTSRSTINRHEMTMIRWLVTFALLISVTAARADSTFVDAGRVSGRWSLDGSPYVLRGVIRVVAQDTLQIGPGVQMFFLNSTRLEVSGALLALGTDRDSVVFTTDTVMNPEGWSGVRVLGQGALARLEYCRIEHARSLGTNDYGLGGGIFCDGGQVVMLKSTIRDCRALSGSGIFARNASVVTVLESAIEDNGSLNGCGGGLCLRSGSTLTLTGGEISGNVSLYGGGLCVDGSSARVQNSTIAKNTASVWGGGLFCSAAAVTMLNCVLSENSSVGGGALDGRWEVWLTMERCVIEKNTSVRSGAEGPGGGLFLQGGEQWIRNCTFSGNSATQGAAVYGGNSMHLWNSIVSDHPLGHGLYFTSGGAEVRYCCFAHNEGGDFAGLNAPYLIGQLSRVNANGDSCDNYSNIYLDPAFDDSAVLPYSLSAGSPCIDAGNPASPRDPDGTVTDIGARWFDHASAVPGVPPAAPAGLRLYPAYPNPFNPATELVFDLSRAGTVSLRVFDLLGREVAVLAEGHFSSGRHAVEWNASAQSAGTYFAVLESGDTRAVQKLLLLR